MVTLKPGMKVLVTGVVGHHGKSVVDAKGVIKSFYANDLNSPCVEFDEDINGYNCDYAARMGHGWYLTLNEGSDSVKIIGKSGKISKITKPPKDFCKILASL